VLGVLNVALLGLLLSVIPILMILGRILAHAARRHTRLFQRAFDVFSTQVQFTLRAMTMTKAHGAEALEPARRRAETKALAEAEPYQGTRRIDFRGGVELEDVEFGYEDVPVLRGVSLRVSPGEHIALIGPNGAGKSTVMALILALYRPDGGRVLMDDVPLDE